MINRIISIVRSVVISPEVAALFVNWALYFYFDDIYKQIGVWYKRDSNWAMAVVPTAAILILCANQAKQIMFPDGQSEKLKDWKEYSKLKDTVLIGLIFSAATTVLSLIIFIFKDQIVAEQLGLIYISILSVAVLCLASMFLAGMNIRIILERT